MHKLQLDDLQVASFVTQRVDAWSRYASDACVNTATRCTTKRTEGGVFAHGERNYTGREIQCTRFCPSHHTCNGLSCPASCEPTCTCNTGRTG